MPTIKPPTMSMMPKPPSIFAMKLARPSGITRNGKDKKGHIKKLQYGSDKPEEKLCVINKITT